MCGVPTEGQIPAPGPGFRHVRGRFRRARAGRVQHNIASGLTWWPTSCLVRAEQGLGTPEHNRRCCNTAGNRVGRARPGPRGTRHGPHARPRVQCRRKNGILLLIQQHAGDRPGLPRRGNGPSRSELGILGRGDLAIVQHTPTARWVHVARGRLRSERKEAVVAGRIHSLHGAHR